MATGAEIIFIQIGGCGNHLGQQFWNTIREEHKLDEHGMFIGDYRNNFSDKKYFEKINSYFKERRGGTIKRVDIRQHIKSKCMYMPRAILIDEDPQILDDIKASSIMNLFDANSFICGSGFASSRWSEHYYPSDMDMIDDSMNIIHKELENCDCFQGFQLCHNIGGGTGSGFTSLLLEKLQDFYPNTINQTFTVHPSFKVSNIDIEAYNAVLSLNKLIENANQTFVIDNEALCNIWQNVLNQKEPTYSDLNWIGQLAMNHSTATFRYDINWYPLNKTIRNMGINLVPFPKLHFLLLSYAPLHARGHKRMKYYDAQELNDQAWSEQNFYANIKYDNGKFLCTSHLWRGIMDLPCFMDGNARTEMQRQNMFLSCIPDSFKYSLHTVPINGAYPYSLGIIANTTSMRSVYERISKQFNKVFKYKKFVYLYAKDGMEQMEFEVANNNLKDLMMEYQDKQDGIYEQESEYDSDHNEEND